MDELQSVGVGIALGILIILILTLYPGIPFDYSPESFECEKSEGLSLNSSSKGLLGSTPSLKKGSPHHLAAVGKAVERVKVEKLQELLSVVKKKTQLLMGGTAEATKVTTLPKPLPFRSYSSSNKTAWFDRIVLLLMFVLFVWVLWTDYSINVLAIIAHMFPRQAEVIRQVAASPHSLVLHVLNFW